MAVRKLKKSEHLAPTARYELLVHLASGGMGAVYLGVEKSNREQVLAIKRAHAHLLDVPEFRTMFVAEARLASLIRHPNAIGVIDVDESDGELLMVMPYVEGGSLGDMLVAGYELSRRVPPAVVLRIVVDAARGLHAAHELRDGDGRPLGMVHRDVSPQNILVGVSGVAAIVDFGVAKAVAVDSSMTATGVLKGKTAYMAPEYMGRQIATPQIDVFSLGVVCWEALANRRLFKGETEMATMQSILSPTPAPMLTEETATDPNVAAIVARALVKDPSKRFHTAAEFADALERRARAAEMLASPAEVAAAVKSLLSDTIEARGVLFRDVMRTTPDGMPRTRRKAPTEEPDTHRRPGGPAEQPSAPLPQPWAQSSSPSAAQLGEDATAYLQPRALLPPNQGAPRARPTGSGATISLQDGGFAQLVASAAPRPAQPTHTPVPAQGTFAAVVTGSHVALSQARPAGAPRVALWAGAAVALTVGILVGVFLLQAQGGAAANQTAGSAEPPRQPAAQALPPSMGDFAAATAQSSVASAGVVASAGPPPASSASARRPTGGWRPKANPYQ